MSNLRKSFLNSGMVLVLLAGLIIGFTGELEAQRVSWSLDGTLPSSASGHGVASLENGIFFFGGCVGGSPPQSVQASWYQLGGGTISKATMPSGRNHMGYVEHEGKAYSIAGYLEGSGLWGRTKDVYSYDFSTDTWATETSLSYERAQAGAASLGDYIYTIGGHHEDTGHGFTIAHVERYNPAVGGSWERVASLNQDRGGLGVAVVGDKIYAIGGHEYEIHVTYQMGGWLEVYDPPTDTWTFGTPMPTPRTHFATAVVENRIYTIGGEDGSGGKTDIVEYYDVNEGVWHSDTPLPVAAAVLKAVTIENRIYILGGRSSSGDLNTIYVSSPIFSSQFSDDFEDGIIDSEKWVQVSGSGGSIEESGGYLKLNYTSGSAPHEQIRTKDDLIQDNLTLTVNVYPHGPHPNRDKTIGFWFGDINEGALSGYFCSFYSKGYHSFQVWKYHANTYQWYINQLYPSEAALFAPHEIEIVKEGSTYVFYIDGEEVTRDTDQSTQPASLYFSMGRPWMESTPSREYGTVWLDDILVESASSTVEVSLSDTTATYEEALEVPVRVSDTSGLDIVAAELFVSYDGDLLTAWSVGTSNTLLSGDWSVETNIIEGNGTNIDTIKIAMATDDDALSGAGDLIDLNFEVADIRHPASSLLKLEHVLFNDGAPGNTTVDGSVTLVGVDGSIGSAPATVIPRWPIQVTVSDIDENRTGSVDSLDIAVANGAQTEMITLTETGGSTGVFTGSISTVFSQASTSGDGIVQAQAGDQIVFSYADSLDAAGTTVVRTATTDVIGGTDGTLRVTAVAQPGDTVRVRVEDADLSESVAVMATNPRTGESESILLSIFTPGTSIFYGRFFTEAQAGSLNDSTLEVQKGDVLSIIYSDTLTGVGSTAVVVDDDEVVDPFGDADGNGDVQAFDAAKILFHQLVPFLVGVDSLAANVDSLAPFGAITPYDASLVLQKRVGLIGRFPVQLSAAVNHPQPQTTLRPKLLPDERLLALRRENGYVSVWLEDRSSIVSGELLLEGVEGQVEMGGELGDYLSAFRATREGLRIVFAGASAVDGPGELLRVYPGVGPDGVSLTRAAFNDGRIVGRAELDMAGSQPRSFALLPAHPNPFNPETTIRYVLPVGVKVEMSVYDVAGQRVRLLIDGRQASGSYAAVWDGRDDAGRRVGSGTYLVRLQAGAFEQSRKIVLLK